MKAKKITVEFEDGPPLVIEVDSISLYEERGIKVSYEMGRYAPTGHGYSDQSRVSITGWKGCRDYDSFQALTEEYF